MVISSTDIRERIAQAFVPEDLHSYRQWGGATTMLIRSSEPPALLAREVTDASRRTLRGESLRRCVSMDELISVCAQGAAGLASLLIALGLPAVTLAFIGTYAVAAYVTELRRREFAARQAGGAEPALIESLVQGQGFLLWLLGSLVGADCVLISARGLAAELYRVSIFSPETYLPPAVAVGPAVVLAAWVAAGGARQLDIVAQIRPE